jgi:hypothetical protein
MSCIKSINVGPISKNWPRKRQGRGLPKEPSNLTIPGRIPAQATHTNLLPSSMKPRNGQIIKVVNYVFDDEFKAKTFIEFLEDRSTYGISIKSKQDPDSKKIIVTSTSTENVGADNCDPFCCNTKDCKFGCPNGPSNCPGPLSCCISPLGPNASTGCCK